MRQFTTTDLLQQEPQYATSRMTLDLLIARNRGWATHARHSDPGYFHRHQTGQSPRCLWIGCADSRVPAESMVQAGPGELFVLRNVANQVLPEDDNIMSGVYYALTALKVDTVIVCGHTRCGGVAYATQQATAAQLPQQNDPLYRQLTPLSQHLRGNLESRPQWLQLDEDDFQRQMVEQNVRLQINQLAATPLFQSVAQERPVALYGCVYDLATGCLDVLEGDTP